MALNVNVYTVYTIHKIAHLVLRNTKRYIKNWVYGIDYCKILENEEVSTP